MKFCVAICVGSPGEGKRRDFEGNLKIFLILKVANLQNSATLVQLQFHKPHTPPVESRFRYLSASLHIPGPDKKHKQWMKSVWSRARLVGSWDGNEINFWQWALSNVHFGPLAGVIDTDLLAEGESQFLNNCETPERSKFALRSFIVRRSQFNDGGKKAEIDTIDTQNNTFCVDRNSGCAMMTQLNCGTWSLIMRFHLITSVDFKSRGPMTSNELVLRVFWENARWERRGHAEFLWG